VSRTGCKIKALRAKTNTYIKTPVRGEEPVFVVTGRKEDVAAAKREILSAAEHFSLIRASRGKGAGPGGPCCAPALPGQTTVQVRVPYRVVGLVVGPRGATIKRIQQQTHTYIVTPSRDKEPVFEVTGMPENVDRAREEIEAHIALRTGAFLEPGGDSDFRANGTDVGFEGGPAWPGARPAPRARTTMVSSYRNDSSSSLGSGSTDSYFGGSRLADFSPTSPFGAGGFWIGEALPAAGAEEPALDSPAFEPLPAPSPTVWGPEHPLAWRARGDPPGSGHQPGPPVYIPAFSNGTNSYSSSNGGSTSSSPPECRRRHDCVLCFESEASAALVPCGHNLFCLQCAGRVCGGDAPACPVCHAAVTQAIQIHS
ncbi:MEX3C ligase, partial [Prunella himalayana]|nr:MEX3C ligase [Prunella himalayana]